MPAAEVPDWIEFWQHEPPGPQSANHSFSAFAAVCCNLLVRIANAFGGKLKAKFSADDFTTTKKYRQHPSQEELTTKLHIWARRANADLKKRGR